MAHSTPSTIRVPRFTSGNVVATPGALDALAEIHGDRWRAAAIALLHRHISGDWGVVGAEDAAANDRSVIDGSRILSAYLLPVRTPTARRVKLWLITEADRSVTTILLPDEY